MPTQVIEFTADQGEAFTSVETNAVGTTTPVKTSTSISEIVDGLYQATFTDAELPIGLNRFAVYDGPDFVGQGLVNITGASGTFRETIEATATVDAAAVADGINETGVDIAGFKPAAFDQLRAAEIDLGQWDPEAEPANIYRGMDHLEETDNAFHFRNTAGSWPDLTGCSVRMELRIAGVCVIAGQGTIVVANGANQHVYVEVLRTAFDTSAIKDGTGVFRVVRVDGSGNLFPLANGIGTLHPNTTPAA